MNIEDIATWAGVAVSLVVSAGALGVSIRALKYQRVSAEMQEIAAPAAVRQADAAERQVVLMAPAGPSEPRLVSWTIEHKGGSTYALRNTGKTTAHGVTVDESRVTAPSRLLPRDATVSPGAAEEFMLIGAFGAPVPPQLWVTWQGIDDPVAVPIPSK